VQEFKDFERQVLVNIYDSLPEADQEILLTLLRDRVERAPKRVLQSEPLPQ